MIKIFFYSFINFNFMSFRKKSIGYYQPSFTGKYCERKMVNCKGNTSVIKQVCDDVSPAEISKTSLKCVSLADLNRSGKVIDGSVSFLPTDPSVKDFVTDKMYNYASKFDKSVSDPIGSSSDLVYGSSVSV